MPALLSRSAWRAEKTTIPLIQPVGERASHIAESRRAAIRAPPPGADGYFWIGDCHADGLAQMLMKNDDGRARGRHACLYTICAHVHVCIRVA